MATRFSGGLRQAVQRADVRGALLSPLSGAALALSVVLAAAAFVAERRGLMAQGAWMAGLGAGLVWVTVAALIAGLSPRVLTGETARGVLLDAFGLEVGRYPETARPVRALIETRIRLAEAVETALPQHRAQARLIETGVDAQIARLIPVAQKAARHRAGLSFHTAMASAAEQRREVEGAAFAGQRAAATDLAQHAEAERLALEDGVASLSGLVARVTLALAKGDGGEIGALVVQAGSAMPPPPPAT